MQMSRPLLVIAVLLLALVLAPASSAKAPVFPEIIPLPDGFQPEGIAIGNGTTFFVGSIPTGAIYRGDVRTGQGALLVQPTAGRQAIGLAVDQAGKRLFVAGGPTGQAYVYDTQTGATIAQYQLTAPGTFVNDVVVTRDAAYFTNSNLAEIYRVALGPGGQPTDQVETITVGGDFELASGFNLNGIEATPNGKWLIVVQSATGQLYRVDPRTGDATLIDLVGETVPNGDGILLQGKRLYVVQNRLNLVAVIDLAPNLTSGTVVERVSNPNFRVPTTIAAFGNRLYVVNARFGTPPTPDTDYDVVQFRRP
jgi:sugar lactone lactonase YvrE